MQKPQYKELLDAGVHFGHLRKKWNPKMSPYIFGERKGIHIIDLNKTMDKMEEAAAALRAVARSGKKILFVATKKQAKEIVSDHAKRVNMPFVTERWLGGMMTNFATIRKSIKKMQSIEKMAQDGSFDSITKKERLMLTRERDKLERVIGGISQLNRLPAALLIVDISHEHIALAEANKLNINTFGLVDTNSDPTKVDFAIPCNDDASKSVELITTYLTAAIEEGLGERKKQKAEMDAVASKSKQDAKAAELAEAERTEDAFKGGAKPKTKTRKPRAASKTADKGPKAEGKVEGKVEAKAEAKPAGAAPKAKAETPKSEAKAEAPAADAKADTPKSEAKVETPAEATTGKATEGDTKAS